MLLWWLIPIVCTLPGTICQTLPRNLCYTMNRKLSLEWDCWLRHLRLYHSMGSYWCAHTSAHANCPCVIITPKRMLDDAFKHYRSKGSVLGGSVTSDSNTLFEPVIGINGYIVKVDLTIILSFSRPQCKVGRSDSALYMGSAACEQSPCPSHNHCVREEQCAHRPASLEDDKPNQSPTNTPLMALTPTQLHTCVHA